MFYIKKMKKIKKQKKILKGKILQKKVNKFDTKFESNKNSGSFYENGLKNTRIQNAM